MKDKNKRIILIISVLIIFGIVSLSYVISNKEYKDNKINKENTINNKKEVDIVAAYIKQEDGTYKASSEIPESGYTINKEKSVCTNGAIPSWDINNNKLILSNLTKGGTNCYLYFDVILSAKDTILAGITPKDSIDNMFNNVATTDEGVFKAEDNDGISYYYRGAVTNNYLKFANKWWRIIRINGDGTIRIIYDGTAYHANGSSTTDSQIGTSTFNSSSNDNAYVGFMYGAAGASTYAATHANTNKSNVMKQLETWYTNNLVAYANKIDMNAGFCGDRTRSTNQTEINNSGGIGQTNTFYGGYIRLVNVKSPILKCINTNDLYTISGSTKGNKVLDKPIGLITADEVNMAGALNYGSGNSSYYLYNGQAYWTISPSHRYNSNSRVFYVHINGDFEGDDANGTHGVRPVINLRADVQITGSGIETDPFVVN